MVNVLISEAARFDPSASLDTSGMYSVKEWSCLRSEARPVIKLASLVGGLLQMHFLTPVD